MPNNIFIKFILLIFMINNIFISTESSKYLQKCSNDSYCQTEPGLVCESFLCVCVTQYNRTSHRCDHRWCAKDNHCQTLVKNSHCLNNGCVCNKGHVLAADGHCKRTSTPVGEACSSPKDCGADKRCVDSICRCNVNHRFQPLTNSCQYFDCRTSRIDCSTPYDPNRECSAYNDGCVCLTDYRRDLHGREDLLNGNKCYFIQETRLGIISNSWITSTEGSVGDGASGHPAIKWSDKAVLGLLIVVLIRVTRFTLWI